MSQTNGKEIKCSSFNRFERTQQNNFWRLKTIIVKFQTHFKRRWSILGFCLERTFQTIVKRGSCMRVWFYVITSTVFGKKKFTFANRLGLTSVGTKRIPNEGTNDTFDHHLQY